MDAAVQELGRRVNDLTRDRARMEAILASMVEGVLVVDGQGRLQLHEALAALLALPYLATVWPFRAVTDATASTATRGWDRFLWLNQFTGFAVTLLLIWYALIR